MMCRNGGYYKYNENTMLSVDITHVHMKNCMVFVLPILYQEKGGVVYILHLNLHASS